MIVSYVKGDDEKMIRWSGESQVRVKSELDIGGR